MVISVADARFLREYSAAVWARDEAAGLVPRRDSTPQIIYAEPTFVTEAAAEADAAKLLLAARIDSLPGKGAECERRFTLHLRRNLEPETDLAEGVEDLFFTACCGNQKCACCWRRRLVKSIRRAAAAVLEDSEPDFFEVAAEPNEPSERKAFTTEKAARQARSEKYQRGESARVSPVRGRLQPRTKAVFVGETTWEKWKDFDRAMRRQLPAGTGRLRVRRGDNSVLVVSENPFNDSRCVRPAEAAELVAAAIEQLHRRRHALRLLGRWSDRKPAAWELVGKLPVVLSQAAIDMHVEALGSAAKRLSGLNGFLVRAATLAEAVALSRATEGKILKSLAVLGKESNRPYFPAPDEQGGFDPAEVSLPDEFSPGGNQWAS